MKTSRMSEGLKKEIGTISPFHDRQIRLLEGFLRAFKPGTQRVLDCGSGIGRVSICLLQAYFDTIDAFDLAPERIDFFKRMHEELWKEKQLGQISIARMEAFEFKRSYDAIVITWVIGFTDPAEEAVNFLRKCAGQLRDDKSCILLTDSVAGPYEDEEARGSCREGHECLYTRNQAELDKLFADADLRVEGESEGQIYHTFRPYKVWVLKPSPRGEEQVALTCAVAVPGKEQSEE